MATFLIAFGIAFFAYLIGQAVGLGLGYDRGFKDGRNSHIIELKDFEDREKIIANGQVYTFISNGECRHVMTINN